MSFWNSAASLFFLLLFSELSAENFKRLAPILEARDERARLKAAVENDLASTLQKGWEKLAALSWTIGSCLSFLAFSAGCYFFLPRVTVVDNLVIGSVVGNNILALSLVFGLVLLRGPLTFFRVRSLTSPVFLLLAAVAFVLVALNDRISWTEGSILLMLTLAYGFYFRSFSSEWKHYEKSKTAPGYIEASEGILPFLAVVCLAVGFFALAVLVSFPFTRGIFAVVEAGKITSVQASVYVVAPLLSLPWLFRAFYSLKGTDTEKARTISSIAHGCLLNLLFVPGINALVTDRYLAPEFVQVHYGALLLATGVFVVSLLIEKEKGGFLSAILIGFYLLYTGWGLFL
jgi:Ca2+/Na+ antiporter